MTEETTAVSADESKSTADAVDETVTPITNGEAIQITEMEQTEPLNQDKQPTPEQVKTVQIGEPFIEIAKRCNLGMVRQRNEDAMFSFVALTGGSNATSPFALGLVADGMGGHHGGDQASRMVSRMVSQQVLNRIYLPMLRDNSPPPISEVMIDAVESANQALYTSDPEKEGGTTLTAVLIVGQRLFLVHVGDSRAYLYNKADKTLQALTTDHTVVQRLQDAGHITAEEAETHPHRNFLYRAMTGHELEIDTYTRSLPEQGKLLICSDGLWGAVEQERLLAILDDEESSLQNQVDLLIEAALIGGSSDNITAVVINFGY
ncbi:MAG: serine/threonine-protein phosphatase [Anaerolineales bacterium]|nr:serine/threonine-protein phosphatase [Anaerolineales bacterium]